MATVRGVNATKLNNVPIDLVDIAEGHGRVRRMYDTYVAGIVASGDVIEMGSALPKGARIIDWTLTTTDLGGTATAVIIQVKRIDTGVAVAIQAAAVVVGDGAVRLGPVAGDIALLPYETLADSQIQLLTSADDTVSGTIKLEVLYSVD